MTVIDSARIQLQNPDLTNAAPRQGMDNKALKAACMDFEALFIKQMLDAMKKTVPKNDLIERGMAEDIFEDMLYQEYAKSMAQTANLGIADMMYKQLSQRGV
ncbi:MAG: flagellar biosynthesis protein FlgJ [Spirochaetales bacterium]|nr:MAG: flagellar biosynthesis protein FlgJ [Spirochaetales bacterium]